MYVLYLVLFKWRPSSLAVIKQTRTLFISKFLESVAALLTLPVNHPVFLFEGRWQEKIED